MTMTPRRKRRLTAAFSLGLVALALFMGFYNLDGDLMHNDEETYLYGAWRVSLGEVPYRDFLIVQTPLSFYLVAGLFKVFGPSVWLARALSYLFILGAAYLLYRAARRFFRFNRWVALAMGAVFLFTKHVYFLGRFYMPDCAMLFFAAAALYFALQADSSDGAAQAGPGLSTFLFGVFSGLAALAKLNAVLLLGGYGIYALWLRIRKEETLTSVLRRLALATAGFLATFGLIYGGMILFLPGTYQATFGIHAAKTKFAAAELVRLWMDRLIAFVGNHNYGLIPIALAGLAFRPVFRDRKRTFLLITALAVLAQVLMPMVFYLRYVVFALFPLAFFFGDGLVGLAAMKKGKVIASSAAVLLLILCLGPAFNLKKLAFYDRGTRAIAAYVNAHTAAGDYVFGETPFANFYAGRPCPPGLVDVSMARTRSGQVTPADIRRECERFNVKLILVEKGNAAHNLKNLIPYSEFQAYLDESYDLVETMPREFLDVKIYRRKSALQVKPAFPAPGQSL